jgi:uncharacterized spore protein YtfJ
MEMITASGSVIDLADVTVGVGAGGDSGVPDETDEGDDEGESGGAGIEPAPPIGDHVRAANGFSSALGP